jgi:hypothetical protein
MTCAFWNSEVYLLVFYFHSSLPIGNLLTIQPGLDSGNLKSWRALVIVPTGSSTTNSMTTLPPREFSLTLWYRLCGTGEPPGTVEGLGWGGENGARETISERPKIEEEIKEVQRTRCRRCFALLPGICLAQMGLFIGSVRYSRTSAVDGFSAAIWRWRILY